MPLWRPGKKVQDERSGERLPPGQKKVKGLPVLHEGEVPSFDPETWSLKLWGACAVPQTLSWADFGGLARQDTTQDFHCVTTWSRFDCRWGGVGVQTLLDLARPTADCTHVLLHASDAFGYTTNLALADFARPENVLATHLDGDVLTPDHGGPMRFVVHHLYAWKSCKWLGGIEFLTSDQRGYWEENGYHNRADPWLEERYSYQETS
jgi:DMSO/TMAO reductase YedYZ molybdopterin-dependent catalytic subunit